MPLSKDSILRHAGVFTTREVHVPSWADESGDDVVLVRGMTLREFEVNQLSAGKEDGQATAALIARCVLDSSGSRLFGDSDVRLIAELGLKESGELSRAISIQSGLLDEPKTDDTEADGEPVEGADLGKPQTSSPQPSPTGSPTDSPGT
jgi:hypothetical protein